MLITSHAKPASSGLLHPGKCQLYLFQSSVQNLRIYVWLLSFHYTLSNPSANSALLTFKIYAAEPNYFSTFPLTTTLALATIISCWCPLAPLQPIIYTLARMILLKHKWNWSMLLFTSLHYLPWAPWEKVQRTWPLCCPLAFVSLQHSCSLSSSHTHSLCFFKQARHSLIPGTSLLLYPDPGIPIPHTTECLVSLPPSSFC